MVAAGCLKFSHCLGFSSIQHRYKLQPIASTRVKLLPADTRLSFCSPNPWGIRVSNFVCKSLLPLSRSNHTFRCHAWLHGPTGGPEAIKDVPLQLIRIYRMCTGSSIVCRLMPVIGTMIFILLSIKILSIQGRVSLSNNKDNDTATYDFVNSFLQPFLLWIGATYICRILDPIVLPTVTSQAIKIRLLNFVRASSTVLVCAYCISGLAQHAQKSMVSNDPSDARKITFQFAGKAIYAAVWIAAALLFMELLGFSTQKLLTAGGLGTVLLTLVGREIFTNFLSSVMIHATRPFVENEWIQTKIEGYEVSGFVERVGWWSPTIIRGEDQEALYIPNHKFTMNVVRNLSQKTHWRIKTHLAISHLDANKINSIVADMRKVLSKHPQVEQKKLHRRVFFESINPENQGLMILISCFVKTSHFDEYLGVKEAVLMDLLRVISHHHARLATPIRTMHKFYNDSEVDPLSFGNSIYNRDVSVRRPLLLLGPLYRANGEDKSKLQARSERGSKFQDSRTINGAAADKKTEPDSNGLHNTETRSETTEERRNPLANVKEEADLLPKSANSSEKSVNDVKPATSGSDNSFANKDKGKEQPKQGQSTGDMLLKEETKDKYSNLESNSGDTEFSKQKTEKISSSKQARCDGGEGENLVLGVALDGSKRTLQIEDDLLNEGSMESKKARTA